MRTCKVLLVDDEPMAADALKRVLRFLIRPCSGRELSITIKQALQQRELDRESHGLLTTVRRQSSILENL